MYEYLEPIFCTLPNEKHENREQTKNTICITVSFWWCFFIREHLPRKETGIAQINFFACIFIHICTDLILLEIEVMMELNHPNLINFKEVSNVSNEK